MRDRYVVSVSAGIQGEPAYDLNHIGISRQSLSNDPGLDETVLDNLYRYVIFKNNDWMMVIASIVASLFISSPCKHRDIYIFTNIPY